MNILLLIFILLSQSVFAQTVQQNDITQKQTDIISQNSQISFCNNTISSAQAIINADNAAIASDQAYIAQYNAQNAQNISGVNWDYFDNLEIAGVRYATFSAVTPGVNWPNITSQLNITCPVAETSVNWSNWNTCENKGVNWSTFYCAQGSC
jgi:hypothetical protein